MTNLFKQPNLENELLENINLCKLVQTNSEFAQNLYCAMCNLIWIKLDMWHILKDHNWSTSWRHAGEIVSKMKHFDDDIAANYMEFYCSESQNNITEGHVSKLVEEELHKIGWTYREYTNND